jgi:hypothetical protein
MELDLNFMKNVVSWAKRSIRLLFSNFKSDTKSNERWVNRMMQVVIAKTARGNLHLK